MVYRAHFLLSHSSIHPLTVEHAEEAEWAVFEERVAGNLSHICGDDVVCPVAGSQGLHEVAANLAQSTCDENPITGRFRHALREFRRHLNME